MTVAAPDLALCKMLILRLLDPVQMNPFCLALSQSRAGFGDLRTGHT